MHFIVPVVLSYLIGSISFSYLYGKLWKGIDIRQHGSGNAGATNTLRVLGKGPAITVLLLDIIKGVLAVFLGKWLGIGLENTQVLVEICCGLAAIIGHNWPVYFGFKGGKGIATTIGVVVSLSFLPALFAGIIAILSIVITRYVSLGSLLFTLFLPIFILLMKQSVEILLLSIVLFIFAVVRHRSNIRKLLTGQENKIGQKKEG
ncbi:glycerol-3-phosphate 1-O-acyltransferase PlsY [Paenibacillus sp. y28]|uniref:glycerol-3-phosphate 1-O-acyltransferase PlsY n=1 Tax=Paenibacillus sp. y28 TaxID=3129110 RepID=UPI0030178C8D